MSEFDVMFIFGVIAVAAMMIARAVDKLEARVKVLERELAQLREDAGLG